jgi:F-box-like
MDILPDDVLLEIFHSYLDLFGRSRPSAGWRGLVQVCQRWRNLVFGSPLHLDVKLHCTAKTSLSEMLDVWPALPISIKQHLCSGLSQVERENVFAILELHQRVCEIDLTGVSNEFLEQVGQVMQNPFPALSELLLESSSPSPLVLPNSFLGGSALRLRVLELQHIPFPALPNLLMSTSDLRHLYLSSIPLSTYIPSQVMVTCLSQMTRLEVLVIEFSRFKHSQTSPPSPPSTRTILPTLTYLRFQGWCNYLEDLVASVDTPLLRTMSLSFFKAGTYDMPQLSRFISCTNQLRSPCRVDAVFYGHTIKVKLYPQTDLTPDSVLDLEILRQDPDQRLSSLAQLCQSLSSLPTLERLDFRRGLSDDSALPYNIENTRWLELWRRFVGVKNLHITKPLGLPVMSALAVLTGDGVRVLPALQNIFLEGLQPSGPLRDNVDQLTAARQSISVHHWNRWQDILQEMNHRIQARDLQRLQEAQQ